MAEPLLVARKVFNHNQFEWVFLIWYIVYGSATLLFLFYFNRVIAWLLSCLIRIYTWHYYRVHVGLQSVQFSPLAGRIFFRGLRYSGRNETILIQDGHITWRYWLLRVKDLQQSFSGGLTGCNHQSEDQADAAIERDHARETAHGGGSLKTQAPCRILAKVRGVQWFIYNRTPAYDSIFAKMFEAGEAGMHGDDSSEYAQARSTDLRQSEKEEDIRRRRTGGTDSDRERSLGTLGHTASSSSSIGTEAIRSNVQAQFVPSFINILPIQVECSKAAVVIGNLNTQSIMVAKVDGAIGSLTASPSGPHDIYQQVIDCDFDHPTVQFKRNKDYQGSIFREGQRACSAKKPEHTMAWYHSLFHMHGLENASNLLRGLLPKFQTSTDDVRRSRPPKDHVADHYFHEAHAQNTWLGLTRYLDEDDDNFEHLEQERWRTIEYARVPVIVDSPSISMSFFWDVPGPVTLRVESDGSVRRGPGDWLNGSSAPIWGIELRVRGGTVNYGPWADKQRADLQNVFFPPLHRNTQMTGALLPGDTRVNTALTIMVIVEEQISLRIPHREASKDWKWRKRTANADSSAQKGRKESHLRGRKAASSAQGLESRSYGWIDAQIRPDSTVSFAIDMIAGRNGYSNTIDVELKGLELSSSVNHALFWRSESQKVSCDLSVPLQWNSLRQWYIDVRDKNLELFILRDHMFLLTDLIDDWSSGAPPDYQTFVPFEYTLQLDFSAFRLYLNANESNVVDNPIDRDTNILVVLYGQQLSAQLAIPTTVFRPSKNAVKFDVNGHNMGLELSTPPWNTQHTFLRDSNLASLEELTLKGSYTFCTNSSPTLTDVLFMDVCGTVCKVRLYGFLIHYLMTLKENYFGDDVHFRTSEEYQNLLNKGHGRDPPANPEHHKTPGNDLDTILMIRAEDCSALLPANLYSADKGVRVEICSAAADLRITNYYMDITVSSSPIAILAWQRVTEADDPMEGNPELQLFVDGLEIAGHRLFGLPPDEPTYVCNWDFDVAKVSGECSIEFSRLMLLASRCFILSMDDKENAHTPLSKARVQDVTFLSARISAIAIALRVDDCVCILRTGDVTIKFNDMVDTLFCESLYTNVPSLSLLVAAANSSRHGKGTSRTYAYAATGIEVNMVTRKRDLKRLIDLQQTHIALHDARTNRTPWLILPEYRARPLTQSVKHRLRPPAMIYPPVSRPAGRFRGQANTQANVPSVHQESFPKDVPGVDTRRNDNPAPTFSSTIGDFGNAEKVSSGEYMSRVTGKHAGPSAARLGSGNSSPFATPYFPLLSIVPDISGLPELPADLPVDQPALGFEDIEEFKSRIPTQNNMEQASIMVELKDGVRTVIEPRALELITCLQEQLAEEDATSVLDTLQLNVIGDILGAESKRQRGSNALEVRLFIPFLVARVINATQGPTIVHPNSEEHYELTLRNTAIITRLMSIVPGDEHRAMSSQMSTHVLAEQLKIIAREASAKNQTDQAVISVQMNDLLFWLLRGKTTSSEVQINNLDIVSAGSRVDYISSLVYHTVMLAESLASRIRGTMRHQRDMLRTFLLQLTQRGDCREEPPFMSSASYIVRTAKHHLRTSHSWWMLAYLRCALANLSSGSHADLLDQSTGDVHNHPKDAAHTVFTFFERLHTWDHGHAASTMLMHRVFGKNTVRKTQDQWRVNASISAKRIRILVEPGASENEILIQGLMLGAWLGNSKDTSAPSQQLSINTISAFSEGFSIRLNWSICDLIENIFETAQSTRLFDARNRGSHQDLHSEDIRPFHIVVALGYGIVNIVTPSAQAQTVFKQLKVSVITPPERLTHPTKTISVVVDVEEAKTEVQNDSELALAHTLYRSQICASRSGQQRDGEITPWNVVCSFETTNFRIQRTPLEMIEIVDDIIQREVSHVLSLSKKLKKAPATSPQSTTQSSVGPMNLHVSLALGPYRISTTILPRLYYEVRGQGLRASVQAASGKETSLKMNMELHAHSHSFRSGHDDRPSEISRLELPPVHAYTKLSLVQALTTLELWLSVEHVKLNATSLHAMFDAVNQPALINLGKSFQQELQLVRHHLDMIFAGKPRNQAHGTISKFAFTTRTMMQKLTIHAATPENTSIGQASSLQISFNRTLLQATNIDGVTSNVIALPKVRLQVESLCLDISKMEGPAVRNCGHFSTGVLFKGYSETDSDGRRAFALSSHALRVDLYTETAGSLLAIIAHLRETLKTIELPHELKDLSKLGRKRLQREGIIPSALHKHSGEEGLSQLMATFSLVLADIRVTWKIGDAVPMSPLREPEDLVLSFQKIDLRTKQGNTARLLVQKFRLQIETPSYRHSLRSANSALLPEVIFNVAYKATGEDLRLAFQAVGKTFDLHLTPQFIIPANDLRRSIAKAAEQVRAATSTWNLEKASDAPKPSLLSKKRLSSLFVYADFAGAEVNIQGRSVVDPQNTAVILSQHIRRPQQGKYGQYISDQSFNSKATLRSPGIAVKVEYKDNHQGDESLSAEMKVSASSNTLYPAVVPLIMDISSSIKETMEDMNEPAVEASEKEAKKVQPKFLEEGTLRAADPSSVLGNCKFNLGLHICQQDFSLSCQPVARVAARARFEDIYFTVNTVQSDDHGRFYTMTANFTGLETSVQHVYSRESSGSLKIDSITVSLMNSRHVTDVNGISAIIRFSPVETQVNAKQFQDFLLFREIWIPAELRETPTHTPSPTSEAPNFVIQRYQQLAATSAFPWNATLSIEKIEVQLDLGSSIGKTQATVSKFWVSSQKSSDWEQNLCVAFDSIRADSNGRMSGLVEMESFKIRTMIKWMTAAGRNETPLVQAFVSFAQLQIKAGFDFQSFFVADIFSVDFLMYNVRNTKSQDLDRLVSVLEGDRVHAFCTTTSASQAYALVQAFQRLIEEKRKAYELSLADIEKLLRRKSTARPEMLSTQSKPEKAQVRSPLRLQTDVVVSLKDVNLGAFPRAFSDTQILRLEALETSARFGVYLEKGRIHSALSMELGQLRVALSTVNRSAAKTLGEIAIAETVAAATTSTGGTILKVPRLVALMQTWQKHESTHIDYIFKSEFQGKVDVGWNYERISYIRSLLRRLGKPMPLTGVQITGLEEGERKNAGDGGQEKITAVVKVPQSKYQYMPLKPPIIETPQLRDMGEATPPLEWIGLHRERLPTLTHQVIIVPLLEVAREVDDAYSGILGS